MGSLFDVVWRFYKRYENTGVGVTPKLRRWASAHPNGIAYASLKRDAHPPECQRRHANRTQNRTKLGQVADQALDEDRLHRGWEENRDRSERPIAIGVNASNLGRPTLEYPQKPIQLN